MASLQPNPQFTPPTRRRGLRNIVGGYSIDRWPIKIQPAEDETARSWFRRISNRYQLTPRQLCDAMEFKLGHNANIAVVLDRHRDAVRAALDLNVSDYFTNHDHYLRSSWLGSFVESAHRFCPACLQENSYWKTSWGLPLSVACPDHKILYIDQCPQCGAQPWHTGAWLGQCAAVHICTARLSATTGPKRKVARWCGADLREASRILAPDTVIQAQAFFTENVDSDVEHCVPEALHRYGINTTESREVLATLVGVAWAHIRRQGPAAASCRADALHTGMAAYQELASANGPTPYLDKLAAAINLDEVLLGGSDSASLYGPVIAAWHIDRVRHHLSPRKQLGWRTGRTWPSPPADPATPWASTNARLPEHRQQRPCVPAAWVPQLLPVADLRLPWKPDSAGRALAAMCLLNLGRGIPWSHIALELGLPAHLQRSLAQRLSNTSKSAWQLLLSSLEDAFNNMCKTPPRINYRQRRITASDPQLLRQYIACESGLQPHEVPQNWLAPLWAAYTGSDIQFAPPQIAAAPSNETAHTTESSDDIAHMTAGPLYARIRQALDAVASQHPPCAQQPP